MSEKLIQSYVKDRWFVSTIHRQSSAALNPDGWYYETMVWNWNAETREREDKFIAQYDSGLTEHAALKHHLLVCEALPDELRETEHNGEEGWYETAVEADDPPNVWSTNPTHWQSLPVPPREDE